MNEYWFWLGESAAPYHAPSEEVLLAVSHCLPDGFDLTDPVSDE